MKQGALAAGLSGTGPAVAALCREDRVDAISSTLKALGGRVVLTTVNNRKARVLREND